MLRDFVFSCKARQDRNNLELFCTTVYAISCPIPTFTPTHITNLSFYCLTILNSLYEYPVQTLWLGIVSFHLAVVSEKNARQFCLQHKPISRRARVIINQLSNSFILCTLLQGTQTVVIDVGLLAKGKGRAKHSPIPFHNAHYLAPVQIRIVIVNSFLFHKISQPHSNIISVIYMKACKLCPFLMACCMYLSRKLTSESIL